jgi:hypothetical protein
MTDIVNRLLAHVGSGPTDGEACVKCAAAVEIERLRDLLSEADPYWERPSLFDCPSCEDSGWISDGGPDEWPCPNCTDDYREA